MMYMYYIYIYGTSESLANISSEVRPRCTYTHFRFAHLGRSESPWSGEWIMVRWCPMLSALGHPARSVPCMTMKNVTPMLHMSICTKHSGIGTLRLHTCACKILQMSLGGQVMMTASERSLLAWCPGPPRPWIHSLVVKPSLVPWKPGSHRPCHSTGFCWILRGLERWF